jgi:hypothetical protein
MIPPFNLSGVLPPFIGLSPVAPAGMSPYATTMTEIVGRLVISPERVALCRGLLAHRRALRDLGVTSGVQWIDGSFCEAVEATRGRAPGDIDTVTLMRGPPGHESGPALRAFMQANLRVFHSLQAKRHYGCEAFFVDLQQPAQQVVRNVTYWFGLFTHQKVTSLWKGILQVDLASDDDAATTLLNAAAGPHLIGP